MDIEQLKADAVYSEDQNRLFDLSIIITEEISALHKDLLKTQDIIAKADLKAQIALLTTLQKIIDKRIDGVMQGELYVHRRFRAAADLILKKETNERLRDLATLTCKDMKKQVKEHKTNKLE
jgi:hypothetical protein